MNEDELVSALSTLTETTQGATKHLLDIAEKAEKKIALVEETSRELGAQLALVETGDAKEAINALLDTFTAPLNETLLKTNAKLDAVSFVVEVPSEDLQEGDVFEIKQHADAITQFVTDVLGDFDTKFEEAEDMIDSVVEQLVETGEGYQTSVSDTLGSLKETMGEGIPSLSQIIGDLFDSILSEKMNEMVTAITSILDKLEKVVHQVVGQILGSIGGVMDVLMQINEIIQPLDPAFDAMELALG